MKGNEAEYVIPLSWLFTQPKPKRNNKAIKLIKAFVEKHTRKKDTVITMEVNEFLWKQSRHCPRRVPVVLKAEGEKIYVYLKGGKQLEADKKARKISEERRKKDEKEKTEKEKAKTAEEKKEEKTAAREQQKKAEEKKGMEKAARATEWKRGQKLKPRTEQKTDSSD